MSIDTDSIRSLRQKTGAGMMTCMRALAETEWNLDAAAAVIAQWGLGAVERRADRETNEGRVAIVADRSRAALAALGCETDFVARNADFIAAVEAVAAKGFEGRLAAPTADIVGIVGDMAMRMQENVVLKGLSHIEAGEHEYLDTYLHGDGKLGAALRVRAGRPEDYENPELKAGIHDLCLQVAACNPAYLRADQVPPEVVHEELGAIRAEVMDDPKLRQKPEVLIAGIIEGKLRKRVSALCLMEQRFIKDESMTVGQFIDLLHRGTGVRLAVTGFLRLALDGRWEDETVYGMIEAEWGERHAGRAGRNGSRRRGALSAGGDMQFMNRGSHSEFDGGIEIRAESRSDFFVDSWKGTEKSDAPFAYQELSGDFVASCRVEPVFGAVYDAGGIFVLDHGRRWLKLELELTDLGYPSIVSVVTNGSSDDSNGERMEGADRVYLQIIRRGNQWAFHHSKDGKAWKMNRYFELKMEDAVKVGFEVQSPLGSGTRARFTEIFVGQKEIGDLRRGV